MQKSSSESLKLKPTLIFVSGSLDGLSLLSQIAGEFFRVSQTETQNQIYIAKTQLRKSILNALRCKAFLKRINYALQADPALADAYRPCVIPP